MAQREDEAGQPATPPARLRELAGHEDAEVRVRVAGNVSTPAETLAHQALGYTTPASWFYPVSNTPGI